MYRQVKCLDFSLYYSLLSSYIVREYCCRVLCYIIENMINKITILGPVIILMDLAGFYLAYLYGHRTKKFLWRKYLAILAFPIAGVFIFSFLLNIKVLILFLISSLVGFAFEYIIGLTYHKTMHERLWCYDRLNINGYTSLLSVPFWGMGGIVFGLLSN